VRGSMADAVALHGKGQCADARRATTSRETFAPDRRQNAVMRITGSDPVLAVHDLDLSAAWYRDVLGCELDDVDPGNWCFCRAGDVTFMLGRCPDVPSASELGDHSYVAYLHVEDVDGFYRRAVAAGAEVLKPPRDESWGMREIGLRSPDGHRFMLGQSIEST
jgi:uncharacterized glyoxalase superfamily protein PhnB